MYTRMVLMVVFLRYRMPFDAHWRVSMLMKKLIDVTKTLMKINWLKWMHLSVSEYEVGVNDGTFSGNEHQAV